MDYSAFTHATVSTIGRGVATPMSSASLFPAIQPAAPVSVSGASDSSSVGAGGRFTTPRSRRNSIESDGAGSFRGVNSESPATAPSASPCEAAASASAVETAAVTSPVSICAPVRVRDHTPRHGIAITTMLTDRGTGAGSCSSSGGSAVAQAVPTTGVESHHPTLPDVTAPTADVTDAADATAPTAAAAATSAVGDTGDWETTVPLSSASVYFRLGRAYSRFDAAVALADNTPPLAGALLTPSHRSGQRRQQSSGAVFQAWGDGRLLWSTPAPLVEARQRAVVCANVFGVAELELRVVVYGPSGSVSPGCITGVWLTPVLRGRGAADLSSGALVAVADATARHAKASYTADMNALPMGVLVRRRGVAAATARRLLGAPSLHVGGVVSVGGAPPSIQQRRRATSCGSDASSDTDDDEDDAPTFLQRVRFLDSETGVVYDRDVCVPHVYRVSSIHGVPLMAAAAAPRPSSSSDDDGGGGSGGLDVSGPISSEAQGVASTAALLCAVAGTLSALSVHSARRCVQTMLVAHARLSQLQHHRPAAERPVTLLGVGTASGGQKTSSLVPFSLESAGGHARLLSLVRLTAAADPSAGIIDGGSGGIDASPALPGAAGTPPSTTSVGLFDGAGTSVAGPGPSPVDMAGSFGMSSLSSLRGVLRFLLQQQQQQQKQQQQQQQRGNAGGSSTAPTAPSTAPIALGPALTAEVLAHFNASVWPQRSPCASASWRLPVPLQGVYRGSAAVTAPSPTGGVVVRFAVDCALGTAGNSAVLSLYSRPDCRPSSRLACFSGTALPAHASAPWDEDGQLRLPPEPIVISVGPTGVGTLLGGTLGNVGIGEEITPSNAAAEGEEQSDFSSELSDDENAAVADDAAPAALEARRARYARKIQAGSPSTTPFPTAPLEVRGVSVIYWELTCGEGRGLAAMLAQRAALEALIARGSRYSEQIDGKEEGGGEATSVEHAGAARAIAVAYGADFPSTARAAVVVAREPSASTTTVTASALLEASASSAGSGALQQSPLAAAHLSPPPSSQLAAPTFRSSFGPTPIRTHDRVASLLTSDEAVSVVTDGHDAASANPLSVDLPATTSTLQAHPTNQVQLATNELETTDIGGDVVELGRTHYFHDNGGDDDDDAELWEPEHGPTARQKAALRPPPASLGHTAIEAGFLFTVEPLQGAWGDEVAALGTGTATARGDGGVTPPGVSSASLRWACWLLEFLLDVDASSSPSAATSTLPHGLYSSDASVESPWGLLYSSDMLDALVAYLRVEYTTGGEPDIRARVVVLLTRLLASPRRFSSISSTPGARLSSRVEHLPTPVSAAGGMDNAAVPAAPITDLLAGLDESVMSVATALLPAPSASSGGSGSSTAARSIASFVPPAFQSLLELVLARRAVIRAFSPTSGLANALRVDTGPAGSAAPSAAALPVADSEQAVRDASSQRSYLPSLPVPTEYSCSSSVGPLPLSDSLTVVSQLSSALHLGAGGPTMPPDALLMQAWTEAVAECVTVESVHPLLSPQTSPPHSPRPFAPSQSPPPTNRDHASGEVHFEDVLGVRIVFHPRCATECATGASATSPGWALLLQWGSEGVGLSSRLFWGPQSAAMAAAAQSAGGGGGALPSGGGGAAAPVDADAGDESTSAVAAAAAAGGASAGARRGRGRNAIPSAAAASTSRSVGAIGGNWPLEPLVLTGVNRLAWRLVQLPPGSYGDASTSGVAAGGLATSATEATRGGLLLPLSSSQPQRGAVAVAPLVPMSPSQPPWGFAFTASPIHASRGGGANCSSSSSSSSIRDVRFPSPLGTPAATPSPPFDLRTVLDRRVWGPGEDAALADLARSVCELYTAAHKEARAASGERGRTTKPHRYTSLSLPLDLLCVATHAAAAAYPTLVSLPPHQLRLRFALQRVFNRELSRTLPAFSLDGGGGGGRGSSGGTVGARLRCLCHAVFHDVKTAVLDAALAATRFRGTAVAGAPASETGERK